MTVLSPRRHGGVRSPRLRGGAILLAIAARPWFEATMEGAMHVTELDTPVLTIDLDIVERNIATTQRYFDERGIRFRPHIKTHKLPILAHKQIDAGAVGITVQKLGEAEVMAAAGIRDIFIAYN